MNKKRILLIDDDLQFGRLTQLTLQATANFEVSVQSDSRKAIETAREFKPDLILLDILMPGLDGGDIERLLEGDPKLCEVPILVVSAIVSENDAGPDGLVQSGGNVMVPKTIDPSMLIQCIEDRLCGKI